MFGFGNQAGGLSWILATAFVLDILGLRLMLIEGGIRRTMSELPVEARNGNGSRSGGG